nr:MAG TPA: ASCH domain protein [Caudoviricetes sp.]
MVRAILDGRKTTTRRALKGDAREHIQIDVHGSVIGVYDMFEGTVRPASDYTPYRPGDILYVRETWLEHSTPGFGYIYKVDYMGQITETAVRWHPSIHMPKEAARIFLRVTDVRAERLQDITPDGCAMEGIELYSGPVGKREAYYKREFAKLWNSTIPQKDSQSLTWGNNPWAWVIEFERTARPDED